MTTAFWDEVRRDTRLAVRQWRSQPIVAIAIVFSLALGCGLTAAAYSSVRATVLAPFPYANPDSLAFVWASTSPAIRRGLSTEQMLAWREGSQRLAGMALFLPSEPTRVGDAGEAMVPVARVEPGLFPLLGVQPALGRWLTPTRDGDDQTVVLSHKAWGRFFRMSDQAIGATLRIDGVERTVVGVMPKDFMFPDYGAALWVPLRVASGDMLYLGLARLKPHVSLPSLQAELDAVTSVRGDRATGRAVGLFPLHRALLHDYTSALWVLLGGAVALLSLVWASVATLAAARLQYRQREFMIRKLLGATDSRLRRQLTAEYLLLGVFAGALGWLVASAGLALARLRAPEAVPGLGLAAVDSWATVLIMVLATASAPAVAVFALSRQTGAPAATLNGGPQFSPRQRPAVRALVLLQFTVVPALVLMAASFVTSFVRLATTDWGFRPQASGIIQVQLPEVFSRKLALQSVVIERLLALGQRRPDVEAVGMAFTLPFHEGSWTRMGGDLTIDGRMVTLPPRSARYQVTHGYFEAMGIPLLRGRTFQRSDAAGRSRVAVVSESFAKVAWPGEDPVGRTIWVPPLDPAQFIKDEIAATPADERRNGVTWEVVGVVGDVRMYAIDSGHRPVLYIDYRQERPGVASYGTIRPKFVVRSSDDLAQTLRGVAASFKNDESGLSVQEVSQIEDIVNTAIGARGSRQLMAAMSTVLGMLGLALLIFGVYAMSSHTVHTLQHELSIRLALGAPSGAILWLVLRNVLGLAAVGVLLGSALALALSHAVRSATVKIEPVDPVLLGVVALILLGAVTVACASPLRRSLVLNPNDLVRPQ